MALSLAYTHVVFFCTLETHSAFYISLSLVEEKRLNGANPTSLSIPTIAGGLTVTFCPSVREEERREAERKREDYELNVDLSSAGCRSKEQHWQAEHRIHWSLLSMPSSSFSEVDEHRGPWL